MKSDANYKMPSEVKRIAATIVDPHARGAYKRAMIAADMAAQQAKNRTKTRREAAQAQPANTATVAK